MIKKNRAGRMLTRNGSRGGRGLQNFVCTIVESEFVSELTTASGAPTPLSALLERLNLLFTAVFAAELAVNALANWFRPFVTDAWSQVAGRSDRTAQWPGVRKGERLRRGLGGPCIRCRLGGGCAQEAVPAVHLRGQPASR